MKLGSDANRVGAPTRFVTRKMRDAADRLLQLNYKEFEYVSLVVADKMQGASDKTRQFWNGLSEVRSQYEREEAAFQEWAQKYAAQKDAGGVR